MYIARTEYMKNDISGFMKGKCMKTQLNRVTCISSINTKRPIWL